MQPTIQLQFPSSVLMDDLMHFLRQSNLTMGIKRWLHPLCVIHVGNWCKKCNNVAATEISMLQISFHCNLLWSQEASTKKKNPPPAINQNHLLKKRKQTFDAEELVIWVVWDVTLCHPISNSCHRAVQWWHHDPANHVPENCKLQLQCHNAVQTYRN